ncbi:hypothetical protein pipiens_013436, partial [Culex pipiens pipiens]
MEEFEEETFWQKAKVQLKCDVPLHLQKVLVRTGYLNSALKDLTDAQIDKIEMDIRRLPELVNLPPGHPNVKSICGKFVEHSKDFAIMSGERALLLNLAKAVQDKGWPYFTKSRARAGSQRGDDRDETALRTKLIDHFTQRSDM